MESPLPSLFQSIFLIFVVVTVSLSERDNLPGKSAVGRRETKVQEENETQEIFPDISDDNDSSQSNLTDEWTTLLPSTSTNTPKPLIPICPCAWIENGGFWNDQSYFYGRGLSFVDYRCGCRKTDPMQCTLGWSEDQQTLTFKWFGMPDSWEYKFQMKFCLNVMPLWRRFCVHNEISYKLVQSGTWLSLLQVNCRCPWRITYPKNFYYVAPNPPTARHFRARYIDMQCTALPWCDIQEPCYSEPIYPDGKLRRGSVLCACPRKYFCPLYYIGGRRRAVFSYDIDKKVVGYQLHCVKG